MSLTDFLRRIYYCFLSKPAADRLLYRIVYRLRPRSILQIGLSEPRRTIRVLWIASCCARTDRIRFTAIDLFEARPADRPGWSLKEAYRALSSLGAQVQLLPGDPLSALSRSANSLTGTDLVLISGDQLGDSLDQSWFYFPRMLHDRSVVLIERRSNDGQLQRFDVLTLADVKLRAGAKGRRAA